jgi:hypothetical protein
MWLINTKTMKLEFFDDPSKLKYAILSHTWGDEEVTFQEWQKIEAGTEEGAILKKKRGYNKIEMTCSIATLRGLKYAWIDTCSIDKRSSSELSEAINSMFRWYESSEICFVHLCDYIHPRPIRGRPKIRADPLRKSDLESCRWFKRGWTLQELIAPKDVVFFDRKWHPMGQKDELIKVLSEITKINSGILTKEQGLNEVCVARRMSWAAHRETTRTEDLAYCLLGIFDINMPLLYGEGKKAFPRLQEEILRRSKNLSLFAWVYDGPSVFENLCGYGLALKMINDLFASCPKHFGKCTKMRSLAQTPLRREDFALTYKGLEIDAVIDAKGPRGCYLELDTWDGTEGSEGWIFLELAKVGNIYLRASPTTLKTSRKSRLVWSLPHAEKLQVCIRTTTEGYGGIYMISQNYESVEISCDKSLLSSMKRVHGYGGEVVDRRFWNDHVNDPNKFGLLRLSINHLEWNSWLTVFPFTFQSRRTAKHIAMAIVCGKNRDTRSPIFRWVGLFGPPAEQSNPAASALTTVAGLSHNPRLPGSEVIGAVGDILFSQISNDLGQVVNSRLPREFVILDENPFQNRSGERISLEIGEALNLRINIRCEMISLVSGEEAGGEQGKEDDQKA